MGKIEKRTFVLVGGAWYGGWIWHKVALGLRDLGHTVTTPTLTGLGERRRCGNDTADLTTHIDDVVDHIMMEDLKDVTLVGWSYGGMVTTGVLARIPEKIRSIIYLDAYVPENGKALIDYTVPAVFELFEGYKNSNTAIPPMPWEFLGATDQEVIDFISPRHTSHPWRTCYEPVKALPWPDGIQVSYIWCASTFFLVDTMERMKANPTIQVETLDADHLCVLTAPAETIKVLSDLAQ